MNFWSKGKILDHETSETVKLYYGAASCLTIIVIYSSAETRTRGALLEVRNTSVAMPSKISSSQFAEI